MSHFFAHVQNEFLSFQKLKIMYQYNFLLYSEVKLFIWQNNKDTKGIPYNNWMYLEISIPHIWHIPSDQVTIVHNLLTQNQNMLLGLWEKVILI